MKNILMICQPLHNRGDESAHKGLLRSICSNIPDIHITVLFVDEDENTVHQFNVNQPNVDYVNIKGFKYYIRFTRLIAQKHLYWLNRFTSTTREIDRYFKECDAVLCAPGGINLGGFQTWNHVYLLNLSIKYNKKLYYYGRSIGPFPENDKLKRAFKRESKSILKYTSYLSLRDQKSQNEAVNLGVHSFVKTLDSAFLDSPKVSIPTEIKSVIDGKPYVVFVPNILIWHFAYKGKVTKSQILDFYSEIVQIITRKYPEHKILMLPQTFNYHNQIRDDINLFKEIKEINTAAPIEVISDQYSSDIQQTVISHANLLIGARYHSVVFSINQAIPFIALSYEHKIAGLLESLNMTNAMVDITDTFNSPQNLNDTIRCIEKKLDDIKSNYNVRDKAKEIAYNAFNVFKTLIDQL